LLVAPLSCRFAAFCELLRGSGAPCSAQIDFPTDEYGGVSGGM